MAKKKKAPSLGSGGAEKARTAMVNANKKTSDIIAGFFKKPKKK